MNKKKLKKKHKKYIIKKIYNHFIIKSKTN